MRILEKFGFKFTKNLGKSNQNLPKSAKNQANLVPLSANQLSNQSANPHPYQNLHNLAYYFDGNLCAGIFCNARGD